jgi:hypothetical protein
MKKEIAVGTIRIQTKSLIPYQKTKTSWKKSSKQFSNINQIVKLFKAHKSFNVLIDKKDPQFLKGQLSPKNQIQGARINILPDGTIIDKAYSLFAKDLTVHDQSSDEHWDVLFQNPGGTWSYCYSLDKKAKNTVAKYKKVHQFDKIYLGLIKNVSSALKDKNDNLALPMYTLLRTRMRIGNEIYYKLHNHKGLTTLKKKNIKIKGNEIEFKYVGKDGVPQDIKKKFPEQYLKRIKKHLSSLKANDFVFISKTGKPLPEKEFKSAFKKYCGQEFYPHIVRSHYATTKVQNYIKGKKKLDKKEVNQLYLEIAGSLGHKKFDKKDNVWKESFSVTVNHYIEPKLVEKVKRMVK